MLASFATVIALVVGIMTLIDTKKSIENSENAVTANIHFQILDRGMSLFKEIAK